MTLSIEIGRNCAYLVEAGVSKSKIVIKKTHYFAFPEEWITDKGIINMEEFSELLNSNLKENSFKNKKTNICINNSSIIYRELIVPQIDEKRLPLLVRSEMISVLNLTPDYIMDYIILEEINDNDKSMLRVLAVAILDVALDSYISCAKACKLRVDVIDSATNAILKLVDGLDIFNDNQQLILADITSSHLRLYLFENGKYVLSRNNHLISYNLEDEKEFINAVIENINKMIQFSYTRDNGTNAKKVVLSGMDELLETIQKRISEELSIPCEIIAKPNYIESNVKYENRYVNAIGSLIRK